MGMNASTWPWTDGEIFSEMLPIAVARVVRPDPRSPIRIPPTASARTAAAMPSARPV